MSTTTITASSSIPLVDFSPTQPPAQNKSLPREMTSKPFAEEGFSFDMLSADMDFEQAYSMYLNLQKNGNSSTDLFLKVQLLNQQYVPVFGELQQQAQTAPQPIQSASQQHIQSQSQSQAQLQPQQAAPSNQANPRPTYVNSFPGNLNFTFGDSHREEDDQFFSNTELNALEKFLDSLASNTMNPLDFYGSNGTVSQEHVEDFNHMFDMHTMKPSLMEKQHEKNGSVASPAIGGHTENQESLHDLLKHDISEVFSHPPAKSFNNYSTTHDYRHEGQLPTPVDSRQSLLHMDELPLKDKHEFGIKRAMSADSETDLQFSLSESAPERKRRRSSGKTLLSVAQKRLNHSHSEQRRRQLCKIAYERCLRLVTNIDDYKNEKVLASAITSSKKKSKRKQINKEGLPNLLKHTALVKVSHEILKIKAKNDQLKQALGVLV